jgi:hypothetical protein
MRRSLIAVLFGIYLCGIAPVDASEPRIPRVRPLTDRGAKLLEVGRKLSPTIRSMLARVDASDIILQIDLGVDFTAAHAATRLVTSTPDFRYVRVNINPRLSPSRRLELLGHELQHVMEIADDPTVRDQAAMHDYFTKIGHRDKLTGAFDTLAAHDVERIVKKEIGQWASQEVGKVDR